MVDLVDKWVAGVVKMRVFTDKWPDCSCTVVFYQTEFLDQQSMDVDTKSWESGMLTTYDFQYIA